MKTISLLALALLTSSLSSGCSDPTAPACVLEVETITVTSAAEKEDRIDYLRDFLNADCTLLEKVSGEIVIDIETGEVEQQGWGHETWDCAYCQAGTGENFRG